MEILKNKLLLVVVGAAILAAIILWFSYPRTHVSGEKIKQWVSDGYTQQFCKVVYPRIAHCVKFSANECSGIVRKNIETCISKSQTSLPERADHLQAKEIYASFAKCFHDDVRAQLLKDYLVDKKGCQRLFEQ